MNASTRIFGLVVWLGGLIVTGALILSLTAARVGEHKSSTYGNAYVQFQNSWGGEIGIIPPLFTLQRGYTESVFNKDAKQYEDVVRTATYPLVPKTINIDSEVDYGEQELDLLVFNAFEAHNTETYIIVNKTQYTGDLLIQVSKPENANLMYDYTIRVPSQGDLILQPNMDAPQTLISGFAPGAEAEIIVTYATKGMDVFKYNLSAYQNNVIERVTAKVLINVDEFGIYRFGLPHNTELTKDGATVEFDVENFSTTQDLGITFLAKQRYLDSIQNLIGYAPMSLAFFLIVTFIFSQIFTVKFNAFHYLFVGMINLFYFLFVAYLIRFFGVFPTFAIAIVLTAAMFLLYAPNVFGKWFAYRVVGVFLFLLTVVFSLIFLMPIFRGLLFVVLVFLIFMSIMVFVSRSDISKWSIVSGE